MTQSPTISSTKRGLKKPEYATKLSSNLVELKPLNICKAKRPVEIIQNPNWYFWTSTCPE